MRVCYLFGAVGEKVLPPNPNKQTHILHTSIHLNTYTYKLVSIYLYLRISKVK
jgi:hypothetical protein